MTTSNRRNWVAKAAIMKKGGAHVKSNKAKRQKDKQSFKRKIRAEQFGSFLLDTLIMLLRLFQLKRFSSKTYS